MDKIKEKFSLICDIRYQSYVEHKLSDILVITMCAVLCGIDSLGGIISYAENKKEFLLNKFGITKIPSRPILSRVLNMVDAGKVAEIITGIMKESSVVLGQEAIHEKTNETLTPCIPGNAWIYRYQR